LRDLDISYFAHSRIDNKGHFSGNCNRPDWFEHFLANQYYDASTYLATSSIGSYALWDNMPLIGQAAEMQKDAKTFGIRHGIVLIKKSRCWQD